MRAGGSPCELNTGLLLGGSCRKPSIPPALPAANLSITLRFSFSISFASWLLSAWRKRRACGTEYSSSIRLLPAEVQALVLLWDRPTKVQQYLKDTCNLLCRRHRNQPVPRIQVAPVNHQRQALRPPRLHLWQPNCPNRHLGYRLPDPPAAVLNFQKQGNF